MVKNILLTGGAGFIGTHIISVLVNKGLVPFVIDNFSNATPQALTNLERITGTPITYRNIDVNDTVALVAVMQEWRIDAVIHLAALKSVSESTTKPTLYYRNNVGGTVSLLEAMQQVGVHKVLFSSSATVYGAAAQLPLVESSPIGATNPYGHSKVMMEQVVLDQAHANPGFSYGILRYFNPIGAHPSGLIGENPNGVPNNIMPYIQKVAAGELTELPVYGNDYPTADGTGERDYIHIMDLAEGHALAIQHLLADNPSFVCNLGTGSPSSVLGLINAFERVNNVKVPYAVKPRRAGDVACVYANTDYASQLLGFKAQFRLEDMCRDAWRFQANYVQDKLNR